jgi:hypothetical protein
MQGVIDEVERTGDVYVYYGTILEPGTWKGIDGHEIKYEDSETSSIRDVFAEAAATFNGKQLVYGHYDKSRKAVKGFNLTTWLEDGALRNKGVIADPEVIQAIEAGSFDLGQSMEAWVWVNNQMQAQRIVGDVVAIGIKKPASMSAYMKKGKKVKLQMEFVEQIRAKLEEQFPEQEDKINAVLETFNELQVVEGEIDKKYVLVPDTKFIKLMADAESSKGTDSLKDELNAVKSTLAKMQERDRKNEKDLLVGEIQVINGEFKAEEFLKGFDDHDMQMALLKAYYERIADAESILPEQTPPRVEMSDEDMNKVMLELTGKTVEEFIKGDQ